MHPTTGFDIARLEQRLRAERAAARQRHQSWPVRVSRRRRRWSP